MQGGVTSIKLGASILEYAESFKLYITTRLRNPHFTPETAAKVAILNFTITREGLQDQLLGLIVQLEKPQLHEDKVKLVMQGLIRTLLDSPILQCSLCRSSVQA
jgi:dynein heavy chain, axonemal